MLFDEPCISFYTDYEDAKSLHHIKRNRTKLTSSEVNLF